MKYSLEQIRNAIEKEFSVSQVNEIIKQDHGFMESFTNRDRGIKVSRNISQSWDGQTNQDDINKAITKIDKSANNETKKESAAKQFIRSCMSEGYYGYMLLRKAIGHKLEHPSLAPWYANELINIPSLINPGGRITLSEGSFVLSSNIDMSTSQVALVGSGYEATKLSGAVTSTVEYIHFSGGISNILIADLYVDGSLHPAYTGGDFRSCIGTSATGNIDGVRIERVKIYSTASKIGGIQFEDITVGTVDNLSIEDCYLNITGANAYGIAKRKKGKYTMIRGNTVIQNNTSGYNACGIYGATQNAIVTNNIMSGNGHTPIAYSPAYHSVIANNVVYGSSQVTEGGIEVEEGSTGHGVGTSYFVAVIGNTVRPVTGTGNWGIYTYEWSAEHTDPHHILIANNIVDTFAIGVYIRDGDYITVDNNILYNNTAAVTNLNGTNIRVTDNDGYNPTGNFAAPAVPASTVAYTNAYGFPCLVSVHSGTVSAIAIDAVATGQTSGSFVVAPGETITLTYSGTPTWVWYGL